MSTDNTDDINKVTLDYFERMENYIRDFGVIECIAPAPSKCEYCRHTRWPDDLTREHNLTADTNGKPVVHGLACKVCLADYWRDRAQAAQLEMAKAIQELRASTERLTDAYQKAIEVLS